MPKVVRNWFCPYLRATCSYRHHAEKTAGVCRYAETCRELWAMEQARSCIKEKTSAKSNP